MSDLLVPSKTWEWQKAFDANHLPILWKAERTLHNKYDGPKFYLGYQLYIQHFLTLLVRME
jgi:hypothetical protein